jgi:hypothetical protein
MVDILRVREYPLDGHGVRLDRCPAHDDIDPDLRDAVSE